MLESLFKNVAGLKAYNFIKKRPEHRCFPVNIAKFLIPLNSKNNCKRPLFDFFNGSLLHRPKSSRFRLYDGVRLQGPTHRPAFLFLSWYEPSPPPHPSRHTHTHPTNPTCVRKSKTNTFDESIKFLYWLYFVVIDGFRSF